MPRDKGIRRPTVAIDAFASAVREEQAIHAVLWSAG